MDAKEKPGQLNDQPSRVAVRPLGGVDRRSTRDLQLLWAKCLSKPSESVLQRGVPRDADLHCPSFSLLCSINELRGARWGSALDAGAQGSAACPRGEGTHGIIWAADGERLVDDGNFARMRRSRQVRLLNSHYVDGSTRTNMIQHLGYDTSDGR